MHTCTPERLERKDKCDSVMLQAAKMEMSFVDGKVCLFIIFLHGCKNIINSKLVNTGML